MSFTEVFGGSPVQPAEVAYRAIALAADTALQWPVAGINTANVAAGIMDVTPGSGGFSIRMPPADEVSVGNAALVSNVGATAFTLLDAAGGTIASIAAGASYDIIVTDNGSPAGSWRAIQRGATTSAANAGALAGLGTTAVGQILGAGYEVVSTSAPTTLGASDRARLYVWTGGSGTLSFGGVTALGNNWFALVTNQGTGALTLDPNASETIDGSTSIALNPGESCIVGCSGVALYTVGRGRSVDFTSTMLVKDVSGSGSITLTSSEAGNLIQRYTGTLTGNRTVVVPAAVNVYYVHNNTGGAFTLTVKTATGTGVGIAPSEKAIIYCDGTNVVDADTFTPIAPTTFTDGNVGAPAVAFQNESNTGIYRPAPGQIGLAILGALRAMLSASGLSVTGAISSTGNATVGGALGVTGATTLSDQLTVGKAAKGTVVPVAYSSSVTLDFSAGNDFLIGTLAGNITLPNPTGAAAGQGGAIRMQNGPAGPYGLTLGSQFKKKGTFSTGPNAINVIAYKVFQSGEILAVINGGFA